MQRALQQQLVDLDRAQRVPGMRALAGPDIDSARLKLQQEALKRRAELGDTTLAPLNGPARGRADPEDETKLAVIDTDDTIALILKAPIHIRWLPDFVNASLTRAQQHTLFNIHAIGGRGENAGAARERLFGELFAILRQTMFFMLPWFALVLKGACIPPPAVHGTPGRGAAQPRLSVPGVAVDGAAYRGPGWLEPQAAWAAAPLGWLKVARLAWAPLYLLLMQKRIYRQGWPMTVLKYIVIAWCCVCLLVFAVFIAFMLTFAQ